MKHVVIKGEFIRLDQLLKYAELVDSGGLAKLFIQEGCVYVEDEVCTMRGKKIRPGQRIRLYLPEENIDEEVEVRGE